LESLHRFNVQLHGTPGIAHHLWNEVAKRDGTVYTPKDENRLSDEVVLFLNQDLRGRGIVVNREVEIRRGEKTDIHIDTFIASHGTKQDKISVIIETKGCWHEEVLTAMEEQLVNRYLKNNNCQHGIYLVGWYECSKWSSQDHRRAKCRKAASDMTDLQRKLDLQAASFSGQPDVDALVLDCTLC
jgi:hypothetical protein